MANYKLLLPKMGESVAEATVIRWVKNPGDHIEADEAVMEIATDKVDSDVPSPVTGKLLEQLCNDNDVVRVGTVIAIIETDEPEELVPTANVAADQPIAKISAVTEETPAFFTPGEEALQPALGAEEPTPAAATSPAFDYEKRENEPKETKQPVFGDQREESAQPVPYTEQLKNAEASKTEDSAKIDLRFYSPLVKNIAAQEGISNTELDRIQGTGAENRLTKDDLLNYIKNRYQPTNQTDITPTVKEPGIKQEENLTEIAASTVTDSIEPGLPIIEQATAFKGTGPGPAPLLEPRGPVGKIPEPGANAAKSQPEPVNQTTTAAAAKIGSSMSGGDEIIEMDRMRRLIADHMVLSKHTSPHVTSFVEADVTTLVLWREKIKASFEKREGEKITFTPIFIEAVVRSIKDMPMINIQVNGTQIIKKKDINISMATALPNGNLIVPVIKKADELNLIGLTKAVNDLANRARANNLKPDDVQGGTFTITNVGSFGNVMGTPIINQPQAAILAVGAIRKKPAVIETLQGDMIGIRHMMFLSLSYDHRVVDGALGGSFVRRVADYLENWDNGREI